MAAVDELELRRLPHAYAAAVDRRDVAGLLELFVPDGRLTVVRGGEREEYRGHAEIPGLFEPLRECEATLHEVAGHDLVLDGDGEGEAASGEVAGVAHHVSRRPGGEAGERGEARDLVMYLRYRDAYERRGGRWRFASRRLFVAWTELRPVRLP